MQENSTLSMLRSNSAIFLLIIAIGLLLLLSGKALEEDIVDAEQRLQELSNDTGQNKESLAETISTSHGNSKRIQQLENEILQQREVLESIQKSLAETQPRPVEPTQNTEVQKQCLKEAVQIAQRISTGTVVLSPGEKTLLNGLQTRCTSHLSELEKVFINRFARSPTAAPPVTTK